MGVLDQKYLRYGLKPHGSMHTKLVQNKKSNTKSNIYNVYSFLLLKIWNNVGVGKAVRIFKRLINCSRSTKINRNS